MRTNLTIVKEKYISKIELDAAYKNNNKDKNIEYTNVIFIV
jgi:hypothetical protein